MVVSRIDPNLNYPEETNVLPDDKKYAATVYETEIGKHYVSIALGRQRRASNLYYYPMYLVQNIDGKNKLTKIGIYEMLISDYSTLVDEDGDLEIDQLDPILFPSHKEKLPNSEAEVHEISETNNEDPHNVSELNVNITVPEEEQIWLNQVLGVKHKYTVVENDGAGDCFFIAVRDALERSGKMVSVKDLRKMLSDEATQTTFEEYENLYSMFSTMVNDTNKRFEEIMNENKKMKELLSNAPTKEKQREIVENAKKLKQEFITLKDEKKTATSYLKEYKFMKGVDSLEKFKKVLRQKKYWADSWAIATLEYLLNVKIIILSLESFEDGDEDNIMQCGEMNAQIEKDNVFNPSHYIVVEKSFNHYRLIEIDDRRIQKEKEIPEEIIGLIKNKCLEKMSGTYALIPYFQQIVYDDLSTTPNAVPNAVPNATAVPENVDAPVNYIGTDALYDPNIQFVFYHKSSGRPLPGKGKGETIPKENVKDYIELSKITDWRRKLDRRWMQKFEAEGHDWGSVEHFYQAGKFKTSDPDFYFKFSLDSGSDLANDATMAKDAGSASGKHKGVKIRPNNVVASMNFFGQERIDRMRAGHRAKYEQNPDLKEMLVKTKNAQLLHFQRNNPLESYEVLMEVRRDFIKS